MIVNLICSPSACHRYSVYVLRPSKPRFPLCSFSEAVHGTLSVVTNFVPSPSDHRVGMRLHAIPAETSLIGANSVDIAGCIILGSIAIYILDEIKVVVYPPAA